MITTEVAFPIPPYEITESAGGVRDFNDFRLWVDGKEVNYQVELKALLRNYDKQGKEIGEKRDVTAVLLKYGIDIPSLGHWIDSHDETSPDFKRLSTDSQKKLIAQGLFEASGRPDEWEVHKTYHWKQTFPAHKILHVRHEYTPGFGFELMGLSTLNEASRKKQLDEEKKAGGYSQTLADTALLKDSCLDPSLQKHIFARGRAAQKADPDNGYIESFWVDYILTTANSWKTPIKKFELEIERGQNQGWYDPNWDYTSFCWDGPVTRVGPHHFVATATDFVPKNELKVLFLTMPVAQAKTDGTGK